jgi:hypothetical protein
MNKYGLSRKIREPIKREVRQRSGFGCVFCGIWIYQYEHFNPEYKDAKTHNADGICLLCGTDHQKVTSGIISKGQVANQYKNPIALSKGYANDYLNLNSKFFVAIGRVLFTETGNLLSVDGVNLLSITQSTASEPMKLNAKFFDDKNNLILEIKNNEMLGYTTNWDIEQKGTHTIFRRKKGEIVLQINIIPPDVIEIERINMMYKSAKIYTDSNNGRIFIQSKNGGLVDLFKGQIITEGLCINESEVSFNKGFFIGVQEGLELGKIDYRAFIDNGEIHSAPTDEKKINSK